MHGRRTGWVLFTWELREKARQRRWFYARLKRVTSNLPPKKWRKVGGSVYLVEEGSSNAFDELLKRFGGPDLDWHKFRIRV